MARRHSTWAVIALLLLAGCGDGTVFGPNDSLGDFVGDWEATALVLTSAVAPNTSADLIPLGSTFNINVQPSGLYTAVLVFSGSASTEIGMLSRSGANTVILDRTFPTISKDISTYSFEGSDRLTLDGNTEFDFNLDGTPDDAVAHFELLRR